MKYPFDANIYHGRPMWSYHVNEANRLLGTVDSDTLSVTAVSPFHGAFLRNDDDKTYVGLEFMTRHKGIERVDTMLLGDEVVDLAYIEY